MSTYPHLPELVDDENDNQVSIDCRKRLASHSNVRKSLNNSQRHLLDKRHSLIIDNKEINLDSEVDDEDMIDAEEEMEYQLKPEKAEEINIHDTDDDHESENKTCDVNSDKNKSENDKESGNKSETEETIENRDKEANKENNKISTSVSDTTTTASDVNSKVAMTDELKDGESISSKTKLNTQTKQSNIQKLQNQNKDDKLGVDNAVNRVDVKETLKSMGLRCEDFTISVYSREQAHAILRKQGVEVTNHSSSQQYRHPHSSQGRMQQGKRFNRGGISVSVSKHDRCPPSRRTNPNSLPPGKRVPPPKPVDDDDDDDDDDCIILDPPDAPVPKPMRPIPPPQARLPQQFQLMGTTVQVNRGAKRHLKNLNQPMAKRHAMRGSHYYNSGYPGSNEDLAHEASVQDTLKRLKNYNISITCRRNAQGRTNRGMSHGIPPHMSGRGHRMERYDRMDHAMKHNFDGERHQDSEEEEDMAKYLECQIGEDEEYPHDEMEMEPGEMEFGRYPEADVSVEEIPQSAGEEIGGKDGWDKRKHSTPKKDKAKSNSKATPNVENDEKPDEKEKKDLSDENSGDDKDHQEDSSDEKDENTQKDDSIENPDVSSNLDKDEKSDKNEESEKKDEDEKNTTNKDDNEAEENNEEKSENNSKEEKSKDKSVEEEKRLKEKEIEEEKELVGEKTPDDFDKDEDDIDEELENQLLEGGGMSEQEDDEEDPLEGEL